MNEQSFISQVKNIQSKLKIVLEKQEMLLKENKKLKIQLENITKQNSANIDRIKHLEEELIFKKYFTQKISKQESKVLKKIINDYIIEIEKYLLALNG